MTKPKVLIVTTWFPSSVDPSSAIFVRRDVKALSEIAELKVLHLCAPKYFDQSRDQLPGVQIYRLRTNLKNPFDLLRAIRLITAEQRNFDLLHSVAVSTLLPMIFVRKQKPWVHTEHWSGFVQKNTNLSSKIIAAIFKALARRADYLVTVSNLLLRSIKPGKNQKAKVVGNIVEVNAPVVEPSYLGSDEIKVVSVGSLIPRKQPMLCLAICHELKARGKDVSWVWVGSGELEQKLVSEAKALGVKLEVSGQVKPREVSRYLSAADVFLGPSKAETFFLGAAEALAMGRPVVAGENLGQSVFIEPPFGEFVTGDNPADFADAILRVLSAARAARAEEIAMPVREKYSAQALAKNYQAIYQQLL